MQDAYECFFLLADYQVADYADRLDAIRSAIMDIALDWLAVGLDPSRSHFVVESQPDLVRAALAEGSRDARQVGQQTMDKLRAALRIDIGQYSAT